jgi:hypothetical protein
MKIGTVLIALLMFIACADGTDQDEKTVLARVNDEILTYEDIIYQIPPQLRENMTDEYLTEAVGTWINTEVVYQRAVEMGLDKEPDVQAMIKWGVKETVAKKLIDSEFSSKIEISPVEIDSVYRAQKDLLKLENDRFRASHILLDDYETAMAIYDRLKRGSKFEDLAMDYSRDRESAKTGGDLGLFTADQVEPSFAEALREMKEGSFSKPVKTIYGYHIIRLTERIKAGSELDSLEAKRMIENRLLAAEQAREFQEIIESLKAEADIETFPLPAPDKRILKEEQ